jgi:hypothetical protein
MKTLRGGVAGNDKIGVIAEPLQAAIPNISMDITICAYGIPKKLNVPHSRQEEPNHDNTTAECWGSEKLTDRQEVHDAR